MANYYDATGVLMLDRVTPVISALFGSFHLDGSYPCNGKAYIARLAEINDPQWSDVLNGLMALAAQLDLPTPDDAEGEDGEDSDTELSMPALIDLIAPHFGADQNQDLANLIEHHPFEGSADLDALFLIATCFDDDHHLVAIQLEGCWSCSPSRLFEFGGHGCFISRELTVSSESTHALNSARNCARPSWLAILRRRPTESPTRRWRCWPPSPTTRFAHACVGPSPTACSPTRP